MSLRRRPVRRSEQGALADFLLARLGDDLQEARWAALLRGTLGSPLHDGNDPVTDRRLAEIDAKMRIVRHEADAAFYDPRRPKGQIPMTPVLRLLALPYADHKDFEEKWRL